MPAPFPFISYNGNSLQTSETPIFHMFPSWWLKQPNIKIELYDIEERVKVFIFINSKFVPKKHIGLLLSVLVVCLLRNNIAVLEM